MKKVFKKALVVLVFLIGCIILAEGYDRLIQFTPANRIAAIEQERNANVDKMNRILESQRYFGITTEKVNNFNKLSRKNEELEEEIKKLQ